MALIRDISLLRDYFSRLPSPLLFVWVCEVCDSIEQNEDSPEHLIVRDYARRHLESWPSIFRKGAPSTYCRQDLAACVTWPHQTQTFMGYDYPETFQYLDIYASLLKTFRSQQDYITLGQQVRELHLRVGREFVWDSQDFRALEKISGDEGLDIFHLDTSAGAWFPDALPVAPLSLHGLVSAKIVSLPYRTYLSPFDIPQDCEALILYQPSGIRSNTETERYPFEIINELPKLRFFGTNARAMADTLGFIEVERVVSRDQPDETIKKVKSNLTVRAGLSSYNLIALAKQYLQNSTDDLQKGEGQ